MLIPGTLYQYAGPTRKGGDLTFGGFVVIVKDQLFDENGMPYTGLEDHDKVRYAYVRVWMTSKEMWVQAVDLVGPVGAPTLAEQGKEPSSA